MKTQERIAQLNGKHVGSPFRYWSTRLALLLIVLFAGQPSARALSIGNVAVTNANNPADTRTESGRGAVGYNYQIGTYEVLNSQYVDFLNAVAATDPYALYNTTMNTSPQGGITRFGSSGSFTYSNKVITVNGTPGTYMANKPVNLVSVYDAMRFANWLHNGGTNNAATETGSYTLLGGTPAPSNSNTVLRLANATVVLPTANEWFKAAYYDPGQNSTWYWFRATRNDSTPFQGRANSIGNITNNVGNVANYNGGADWGPDGNIQDGNLTTAGSAGVGSSSYYGTFDQGGNVWEWVETFTNTSSRFIGGGSLYTNPNPLYAPTSLSGLNPQFEGVDVGFRIAFIPEPSACALLAAGMFGLWRMRKKATL